MAVVQAEREVQTVSSPRHAQYLRRRFVLRHTLLLRRPQPQIRRCTARKLLRHGVVSETLDAVHVRILEDALRLRGPDDDLLVRPARSELLALLRISNGEDSVL